MQKNKKPKSTEASVNRNKEDVLRKEVPQKGIKRYHSFAMWY